MPKLVFCTCVTYISIDNIYPQFPDLIVRTRASTVQHCISIIPLPTIYKSGPFYSLGYPPVELPMPPPVESGPKSPIPGLSCLTPAPLLLHCCSGYGLVWCPNLGVWLPERLVLAGSYLRSVSAARREWPNQCCCWTSYSPPCCLSTFYTQSPPFTNLSTGLHPGPLPY